MSPTVERCACGGALRADYANAKDVEAAVKAHQLTFRHREWAARMGYVDKSNVDITLGEREH